MGPIVKTIDPQARLKNKRSKTRLDGRMSRMHRVRNESECGKKQVPIMRSAENQWRRKLGNPDDLTARVRLRRHRERNEPRDAIPERGKATQPAATTEGNSERGLRTC